MKSKKPFCNLFALCLLIGQGFAIPATAVESVPPLINYQGALTDANGAPMAGVRDMEFNLYNDPTKSEEINRIWGPQIYASVPLINGKFNVLLGATDTAGRPITGAFADKTRYLSIKIKIENEYKEILPRQQILSTPFAMQAQEASHAKEADHAALADGTKAADFTVPANGFISSPGRTNIRNEEYLVMINKGTFISRAGGGSGNLIVEGALTVSGHVQNEQGKPAFLVSVEGDDCNWAHPYLGCPAGYYIAGRWHVGNFCRDGGSVYGVGYDNGNINSGWMALCVAN